MQDGSSREAKQAERQQRCDNAWLFLLRAVAEHYPADVQRGAAITALRRPRSLKTLTGLARFAIVEQFRVPVETVILMPGTLADLLVLGAQPGPDGSASPVSETYERFNTWKLAKLGAVRRRRDLKLAVETSLAQWRRSREAR